MTEHSRLHQQSGGVGLRDQRLNRRQAAGGAARLAAVLATAIGGIGLAPWRGARGQDTGAGASQASSTPSAIIQSNAVGEMPTTGALRPGPVGQPPPRPRSLRTTPVAIVSDRAQIDAEVEVLQIVDGVMQNPTGPWVVAWYEQTAQLGEPGNVVMAGHVDYWGVGPSVFYNVKNLAQGDEVALTGSDNSIHTYAVESIETIGVEELTSGRIGELVGPMPGQVLTLITCGGEFDYVNGEYLSRTAIRATFSGVTRPAAVPSTPRS